MSAWLLLVGPVSHAKEIGAAASHCMSSSDGNYKQGANLGTGLSGGVTGATELNFNHEQVSARILAFDSCARHKSLKAIYNIALCITYQLT